MVLKVFSMISNSYSGQNEYKTTVLCIDHNKLSKCTSLRDILLISKLKICLHSENPSAHLTHILCIIWNQTSYFF